MDPPFARRRLRSLCRLTGSRCIFVVISIFVGLGRSEWRRLAHLVHGLTTCLEDVARSVGDPGRSPLLGGFEVTLIGLLRTDHLRFQQMPEAAFQAVESQMIFVICSLIVLLFINDLSAKVFSLALNNGDTSDEFVHL